MSFLLYHPRSAPTGRVLAEALGLRSGSQVPRERFDVILRWGCQRSVPLRASHTINNRMALARASDKLGSLRLMREDGVQVPNFSRNYEELTPPFLGRTITHRGGTDIVLCMQRSDAARNPRDFYTEYIPTRAEYRIHVYQDRAIRASQKVLTHDENYCPYIRNHEHGYTFRRPRRATPITDGMYDLAIKAVAAHGLHFGAVDLILGDNGEAYVLEVNTAPSCSPLTGRAYVEAMTEHLTELGAAVDPNYDALEGLRGNADEDADA